MSMRNSLAKVWDKFLFAELTPQDIPDLLGLEKQCFSVPWTDKQYRTVFGQKPFRVFGLKSPDCLMAYLTLFAADWEMEILNLAVRPDMRRQGLGRRLLGEVLRLCQNMGIKRGYLEVRRSNDAARNLYQAYGFVQVGVRGKYYPDNREDAIVMRLDFGAGSNPDKGQDPDVPPGK